MLLHQDLPTEVAVDRCLKKIAPAGMSGLYYLFSLLDDVRHHIHNNYISIYLVYILVFPATGPIKQLFKI